MNASSGAACASPLTVRAVRAGRTTCLSLVGRADASNHDQLEKALRTIVLDGTDRVELDLAGLDSCAAEAAFELAAFAGEARDRGVRVALAGANPWVLTILTVADVAGVLVPGGSVGDPPA